MGKYVVVKNWRTALGYDALLLWNKQCIENNYLCGYIALPKNNKYSGLSESEPEIEELWQGNISYSKADKNDNNIHWLGFYIECSKDFLPTSQEIQEGVDKCEKLAKRVKLKQIEWEVRNYPPEVSSFDCSTKKWTKIRDRGDTTGFK